MNRIGKDKVKVKNFILINKDEILYFIFPDSIHYYNHFYYKQMPIPFVFPTTHHQTRILILKVNDTCQKAYTIYFLTASTHSLQIEDNLRSQVARLHMEEIYPLGGTLPKTIH